MCCSMYCRRRGEDDDEVHLLDFILSSSCLDFFWKTFSATLLISDLSLRLGGVWRVLSKSTRKERERKKKKQSEYPGHTSFAVLHCFRDFPRHKGSHIRVPGSRVFPTISCQMYPNSLITSSPSSLSPTYMFLMWSFPLISMLKFLFVGFNGIYGWVCNQLNTPHPFLS